MPETPTGQGFLPSAHRKPFGVSRRMVIRACRDLRRSAVRPGRMLRRGADRPGGRLFGSPETNTGRGPAREPGPGSRGKFLEAGLREAGERGGPDGTEQREPPGPRAARRLIEGGAWIATLGAPQGRGKSEGRTRRRHDPAVASWQDCRQDAPPAATGNRLDAPTRPPRSPESAPSLPLALPQGQGPRKRPDGPVRRS